MHEIRPLLHEMMNALAIARGLTEGVIGGMKGDLDLSAEQKLDKLERAVRAMDRIEVATKEVRSIVSKNTPGKV